MADPLQKSISDARGGDRVALESLFGRHMPQLVAFMRVRMGRLLTAKESVHDLAQSVCREVLQDADEIEYQGEAAFHRYLLLQATRKILDRKRYWTSDRRDAAKEVELGGPGESQADIASIADCYASLAGPSKHAAAQETMEKIEAALEKLPENQREAVALARLMNLTYPEIAGQMGLSESAVRGLVARGLARLTLILGPDR